MARSTRPTPTHPVSSPWAVPRRDSAGPPRSAPREPVTGSVVNDIHSQLNPALVAGIARPRSTDELAKIVRRAAARSASISICAGRHAMGGQQFGDGTLLIDTGDLRAIRTLDHQRGLVTVGAGITWPDLIRGLLALQGPRPRWGIIQKQTGANHLSIGGALAANIHGRGLTLAPFVADVESFTLVRPDGAVVRCARDENADLFRLVAGGYGLFGVVAEVTLRLAERFKLRRVVRIIDVDDLVPAFEDRILAGFRYGDFQFAIDPASPDFLRRGVFSCYEPVADATPVPTGQRELRREDWLNLLELAHRDKGRAFRLYKDHYLATDGQVYWSDLHQLTEYVDDYHTLIDERLGCACRGTEMITEVYIPRHELASFMHAAAADLRRRRADVIYGTVRLIRRDREAFLPWATRDFACIVMNLHIEHSPAGLALAGAAFRSLIDLAIERAGSFYLTYHTFATREQILACYPQFAEFLRLKRLHDPSDAIQSNWYRRYAALFE